MTTYGLTLVNFGKGPSTVSPPVWGGSSQVKQAGASNHSTQDATVSVTSACGSVAHTSKVQLPDDIRLLDIAAPGYG